MCVCASECECVPDWLTYVCMYTMQLLDYVSELALCLIDCVCEGCVCVVHNVFVYIFVDTVRYTITMKTFGVPD